MFRSTLAAELAKRIGTRVEVTTDNNMVDGILSSVTPELVLVIDVMTGYNNEKMYVSLNAINYVRFLTDAAAV